MSVAPSLMFEDALTPVKGWFEPAALDFTAKLSANVTFVLSGGRVVHLNSVGEFETGVSGSQMGMTTIQPSDAFDVSNPGTTAKGTFVHQAIAPTGVMSALVAEGAYELQTTEFAADATFAVNDLLTADVDNADATKGGVLDNRNAADASLTPPWAGGGTTVPICGVVSRAIQKNEHKQNVIHYWPTYIPGTT